MSQQDRKDPALADASQVEQLADSLSAAADALHARVMLATRQRPLGGKAPAGLEMALSQAEAQSMFDAEVSLRQRANELYLDAGGYALRGLGASQRSVIELTEAARQKIAKIGKLKDLLALGADLLALAGAVVAGKADGVVDALEQMRSHIADLKKDRVEPAN
ncbi:hypothetical protein [Janthinobacterium fluminis]|uniref:Phasin family protein n=1 Tax=Janthinobacterium fluminis TaxID=2987524 RepID=A0ABT5K596_9BURK|nr:hypothetical protein [Janthinobacterium fluminis]MDC8760099.1 hypothetical protein [Janthinobacterium fluminis]